jgi:hypothetical protein
MPSATTMRMIYPLRDASKSLAAAHAEPAGSAEKKSVKAILMKSLNARSPQL